MFVFRSFIMVWYEVLISIKEGSFNSPYRILELYKDS